MYVSETGVTVVLLGRKGGLESILGRFPTITKSRECCIRCEVIRKVYTIECIRSDVGTLNL